MLQNELKQAKGILHHPKLKLRVHNRLKDYVEEYEQDDEEEQITMASKSINQSTARNKTLDNKKKVYSRRANQDHETNFTSTYSERMPNYTKIYSRRSTVPDGYKTRLSPI